MLRLQNDANTRRFIVRLFRMEDLKTASANTIHWIHLKMDASQHPEFIADKIKWFSGKEFSWLIPGYNDAIQDGRNLRAWPASTITNTS